MTTTAVLTPKEISSFCTQINYFLRAGIPVREGIATLLEDNQNAKQQSVLKRIDEKLTEGFLLAEAMDASGAFLPYVVNMVRIGENAGQLDEVLASLSLYYDRETSMNEQVRSAVLYPIMLFIMMSFVVGLLVFQVLPMFRSIFDQLGGEISQSAEVAMNFGIGAGLLALAIIAVIFVLLLVLFIKTKASHNKIQMTDYLDKIPFTKELALKIAACRFTNAFSLMLSSGIELNEAVDQASALIENNAILKKLEEIRESSKDSEIHFIDMLTDQNIFPGLFSLTTKIAFKTGMLDDLMAKLASLYEEEVTTQLNALTATIEPILVGILSFIIGSILISVMLPLVGIMTSIG